MTKPFVPFARFQDLLVKPSAGSITSKHLHFNISNTIFNKPQREQPHEQVESKYVIRPELVGARV